MKLKDILIVANIKNESTSKIVDIAIEILKKKNIKFDIVSPTFFQLENKTILTDLENSKFRNFDLIIAIGGDGTFLFTARYFYPFEFKLLGMNAGRLGFLMEISPENLEDALKKIENDDLQVKERLMFKAFVLRDEEVVFQTAFLNDAVISKGVLSRMVEISVSLMGTPLAQYRADGLIISTPTGSTAYNLAAGGPILTQDVAGMIITPICPHSLGVRPIVSGIEKELKICFLSGGVDTNLTIDGQENFLLKVNDKIIVKKEEKCVKIYDYGERQFFSVLREKLGWHI